MKCIAINKIARLDGDPETSALSDAEKRSKFLGWAVAHAQCSLDNGAKWHKCPLIHCRDTFPSADALKQHLSDCVALPTGIYLCPFCGRLEYFLPVSKAQPFRESLKVSPPVVDGSPDGVSKRRQINLSTTGLQKNLPKKWRSATRGSVSVYFRNTFTHRKVIDGGQATTPTPGKAQASDHPPAYHEKEKLGSFSDEQHPANRLQYDSNCMKSLALSPKESVLGVPGWDEMTELPNENVSSLSTSSGCASPRLGSGHIIGLFPSEEAQAIAGLDELSSELECFGSTPISPLTPTSAQSQWGDGEKEILLDECDFLSSQSYIPQHSSPVFELGSQSATAATQQIAVTSAQGSLSVSNTCANQEQNIIPGGIDHCEHGTITDVSPRRPPAAVPFEPVYGNRPSSMFSCEEFHELDGLLDDRLDAKASQIQQMQDVGLTILSPTRSFVAVDRASMNAFANHLNATHLAAFQTQALSQLSAEIPELDGCQDTYPYCVELPSEASCVDQQACSADEFVAPNFYRFQSTSFTDLASFSTGSPISFNLPTLSSHVSTMTVPDSPFTQSGLQNHSSDYDSTSPLLGVNQLAYEADWCRCSNDSDIVYGHEVSSTLGEAQKPIVLSQGCFDCAPPELETNATPAANNKANTRKRKHGL